MLCCVVCVWWLLRSLQKENLISSIDQRALLLLMLLMLICPVDNCGIFFLSLLLLLIYICSRGNCLNCFLGLVMIIPSVLFPFPSWKVGNWKRLCLHTWSAPALPQLRHLANCGFLLCSPVVCPSVVFKCSSNKNNEVCFCVNTVRFGCVELCTPNCFLFAFIFVKCFSLSPPLPPPRSPPLPPTRHPHSCPLCNLNWFVRFLIFSPLLIVSSFHWEQRAPQMLFISLNSILPSFVRAVLLALLFFSFIHSPPSAFPSTSLGVSAHQHIEVYSKTSGTFNSSSTVCSLLLCYLDSF